MKRGWILSGLLTALTAWCVTTQTTAVAAESEALERAFARLAQYDFGDDYTELAPIERAVHASLGRESARAALEARLVTVLTGPAPNGAKDYACRTLTLIGTETAVPALAALLPDEELSGIARYALERIPGEGVNLALRNGLSQTSGRFKAGVINSIGIRRDAGAVSVLSGLVQAPDPVVAEAALLALGKIGTRASADVLAQFRGKAPVALAATLEAAFLEAADRLMQDGNADLAAGMFEALYRDHEAGAFHMAGFQGLIAARPADANRRLLAALSGDDVPVRHLAARLIVELPGETPPVFLEALGRLVPDAQIALLGAFRLRADPAARQAVLPMLGSSEASVRLAAIEALGTVGSGADVIRLAEFAARGPAGEREAGRNSLVTLAGREINEAILAAVARVEPGVRVELLRSLIGRVARESVSSVAGHLGDSDARVGRAAAEVLSAIGDEGQVPSLVRFVIQADAQAQRDAGARALTSIAGRVRERAAAPILDGIREADRAGKSALLSVLPVVGGDRSLAAVRAGLKDQDDSVRDAAVRALINWRELAAAPDLLGIIRTTEVPAHRVLAFRGYVRLGREVEVSPSVRLGLFKDVADLARTTEDKRLLIGAIGDIPTIEALRMVVPYLAEEELADEAGAAIVKIAPGVGPSDRAEAVEALRRVTTAARSQSIRDDAQRAIDRPARGGSRTLDR